MMVPIWFVFPEPEEIAEREHIVDRISELTGFNRATSRHLLTEFETAIPGDFGMVN
jgi:hypothetical protein